MFDVVFFHHRWLASFTGTEESNLAADVRYSWRLGTCECLRGATLTDGCKA